MIPPRPEIPDVCPLCRNSSDLVESHVLSGFVAAWLKRNSATGFLRSSLAINRRVQDSEKVTMLCRGCEQRLGEHETKFAQRFFHPYLENPSGTFPYGGWMSRFAASQVWRSVEFRALRGDLEETPVNLRPALEEARSTWRSYLLGDRDDVGEFELHLFRLDLPMEVPPGVLERMPANFSRYVRGVIGEGVAAGAGRLFVWAKLTRFFFLGFVAMNPVEWVGTKLAVGSGVVAPAEVGVPRDFLEFLLSEAKGQSLALRSLSFGQREIMQRDLMKNPNRTIASESFKSMENDVQLFGTRAFTHYLEDDGEGEE